MSKINKLGKSSIAVAILSFLLVAVLAFGGTYAYFSDKASVSGTAEMGHLQVAVTDGTAISETFEAIANGQPGQYLIGTDADTFAEVDATVTTNINYYIRVRLQMEVTPDADYGVHNGVITPAEGETPAVTDNDAEATGDNVGDDHEEILTLTYDTATWTRNTTDTEYFYLTDFAKIETTDSHDHTFAFSVKANEWVGAYGCTHYMDAAVKVTVSFEVLQAEYLEAAIAEVDGVDAIADADDLHAVWDTAVAYAQENA